jgi:hypothetical protein
MSVVRIGPWSPPEEQARAAIAALERAPVKTFDDAERIAHLKMARLELEGGRKSKRAK